jgi:hypothetical protein
LAEIVQVALVGCQIARTHLEPADALSGKIECALSSILFPENQLQTPSDEFRL